MSNNTIYCPNCNRIAKEETVVTDGTIDGVMHNWIYHCHNCGWGCVSNKYKELTQHPPTTLRLENLKKLRYDEECAFVTGKAIINNDSKMLKFNSNLSVECVVPNGYQISNSDIMILLIKEAEKKGINDINLIKITIEYSGSDECSRSYTLNSNK